MERPLTASPRGAARFFANGGRLGRCRAGRRMAMVNPDACSACYTSSRGD